MKNLILYLAACLLWTVQSWAQDQAPTQKGNNVFIENTSKNENAIKTVEALRNSLKEWGYWEVVPKADNADFKIQVNISASKGITLTSWGGTSYILTARLTDKKDQVLWESNSYRSSPNGTNGFNSGNAVVRKLMRDLKKKYQ